MTVIGIDSHKDLLAACLVDASGVVIEQRSIANTEAGHAELVGWARAVDAQRVGIEGAGNYGRPAAEALIDAGAAVLEVPPQMTAAARRGRACQIVCVRGWFEIVVRGCFGSGLWKGPF